MIFFLFVHDSLVNIADNTVVYYLLLKQLNLLNVLLCVAFIARSGALQFLQSLLEASDFFAFILNLLLQLTNQQSVL